MPEFTDSFDKVVTSYFSAITRSTFTYRGKTYNPKTLVCSPMLFRGYTCPEHCGGCCPRFSLDYLPFEQHPTSLILFEREIEINEQKLIIFSDMQVDHDDHHCRNLIKENGRCSIHGRQPFSCDFELIRLIHYDDYAVMTQKLFGRGWNFLRTDGQRGARCEITEITKETVEDTLRKLYRLKEWADYFNITHCLDAVIKWAESNNRIRELVIAKDSISGFMLRDITEIKEPLVKIGE